MNVSDPTLVAELVELAESIQIELDAIANELDAVRSEFHDLNSTIGTVSRKLANVCENLADVLGERPVPAVLEFEEVDR